MRRILIGASRHIEYDMRNDLFAHLEKLPLGLLPGAPYGRSDVARHQRSERRADDDRAVDHVFREHAAHVRGRADGMITIDAKLTLLALIPLPFVSISVKVFGSAIHKRFEQIQAQLSDVSAVAQEACPASASSAPTGRKRRSSNDFGSRMKSICGATAS